MSAIFGVVYFDGTPVSAEAQDYLAAAHTRWGRDRLETWREGSAALGVALRFNTPEAHHGHMPFADASDGSVAAVIARLDNRDELCDAFEIPSGERPSTSDARLAHLAYQRWGDACAAKLFGDWSMAVWHPRDRRIFLARDHLNASGLYYHHRGPLFAFASDVEAIAHMPEVSSPIDEGRFARYLAILPGEPDRTMWRDVRLLQPSHTLTCTLDALRLHEYWRPENVQPVQLRSTSEYVEGFLDRYRRATRVRLRSVGPVGTTLSSGLDSSSVTALAAEALRSNGARLTAFTSVPVHSARHLTGLAMADEGPMAAETARWCGNVDHVLVGADDVSPLAALERSLNRYAQPLHAAANLFWFVSLISAARERGLGTLLLGQLGNVTISWSGGTNRHLYLFAKGRWIAGMRTLASWRVANRTSWRTVMRYQILAPVLAPAWRQRKRLLGAEAIWARHGALNPAFADRLALDRDMRNSQWHKAFGVPMPPKAERFALFRLSGGPAGAMQHAFGSAFGLDLRDPTADVRLVEYCLGVPEDQHADTSGNRLLVRRAMSGLLPPAVQWNVQRGRQAADVAFRVLQHPHEMEALLDRLQSVPAVTAYVDVARLRAAWHDLQRQGVTRETFKDVVSLLLPGLLAGLFLERQVGRCDMPATVRASPSCWVQGLPGTRGSC